MQALLYTLKTENVKIFFDEKNTTKNVKVTKQYGL